MKRRYRSARKIQERNKRPKLQPVVTIIPYRGELIKVRKGDYILKAKRWHTLHPGDGRDILERQIYISLPIESWSVVNFESLRQEVIDENKTKYYF